jgi:hypothetical protein
MARGMEQKGNAMDQRRRSPAQGLESRGAVAEAHSRKIKRAFGESGRFAAFVAPSRNHVKSDFREASVRRHSIQRRRLSCQSFSMRGD